MRVSPAHGNSRSGYDPFAFQDVTCALIHRVPSLENPEGGSLRRESSEIMVAYPKTVSDKESTGPPHDLRLGGGG